jgi:beta-1,4-mannosyl-glycoprotein beta-1,4-N-acetylglucosaminyltransferase
MKNKIFDCITFFKENFITNIRFEILKNVVDYFVICESRYDHNGNKKKLNFQLQNSAIKNKIKYIVLEDPFPIYCKNNWERQAFQRDYMLNSIKNIKDNDYIFFSDPDEIPNPKILRKFNLKKNMEFFCKIILFINLIYLMHMILLGLVHVCVNLEIYIL